MESIPRTSGIYQILCVPTGKVYIGSAVNINDRWCVHLSNLRRGVHCNVYLQSAWKKYGESAFALSVLEEVAMDRLRDREQFYITLAHAADRRYGFNLRRVAMAKPIKAQRIKQARLFHHAIGTVFVRSSEGTARIAAFWRGRKHRPESIERMSAAKKGKPEHPNTAKAKIEATSRWYVVTDPDGKESTIKNLTAFCREHKLTPQLMHLCAQGKASHHKGWKCQYLV